MFIIVLGFLPHKEMLGSGEILTQVCVPEVFHLYDLHCEQAAMSSFCLLNKSKYMGWISDFQAFFISWHTDKVLTWSRNTIHFFDN